MAKRVTPEEIVEMHRLYAKLGTYEAVGHKMNRHGSTVAKYIKMNGIPQNLRLAVESLLQKG